MIQNKAVFATSYSEVKEVISNFRNNRDLPFITNSGVIETQKLSMFLDEIKKLKAASVKIYLFRENLKNMKVHKAIDFVKASDTYSQVSFLIVPHDDESGTGKDIVSKNGEIVCLFPGGESSGLCPNNCGGSE